MNTASDTLRKLQLTELCILKKFIKICEENGLRYYLCGGTLLGAIRHKGFIPWDDDIDIAMPREDYIRFNEVYKEKYHETDDKFFIDQTEAEYTPFVQIFDRSIKVIDKFAINQGNRYAWIDIFPIDGFPGNIFLGNLHAANFLLKKVLFRFTTFEDKVDQKRKRPFYKKIILEICNKLKIYKFFNDPKKHFSSVNKVLLKYSMYKTSRCCTLWGAYELKELFSTDWFGLGVPVKFEDITANAPCNYDLYLRQLYGNYMELPPEDKRQAHDIEIIIAEETK